MSICVESRPSATDTAILSPLDEHRLLPLRPVVSRADHLARFGAHPRLPLPELMAAVTAVGLNGRGGGAFPLARKLAGVSDRGGRKVPVVIVNAAEGDPTSGKDRELLRRAPHLVLDGLHILADALGAQRRLVAAHAEGEIDRLWQAAAAEGSDSRTVERVGLPARFVASEASSLVNFVNHGDARPLGRFTPIWEKGVGGAPTLVVNAETAAQVSLLARYGPEWFAALGRPGEPGTVLATVTGAVPQPGVHEVASGVPVGALLARSGAPAVGTALIGGLAGSWVRLEHVAELPWTVAHLRSAGVSRGVGSIVVLGPGGCPLAETARILAHLAAESARQCGPCLFGLPAVAADFEELASGDADAVDRLSRRLPVIAGRGGCSHPDGAVAMAGSAMRLLTGPLAGHLAHHLGGGGCGAAGPFVPLTTGR